MLAVTQEQCRGSGDTRALWEFLVNRRGQILKASGVQGEETEGAWGTGIQRPQDSCMRGGSDHGNIGA